jgi:hypothetical protein
MSTNWSWTDTDDERVIAWATKASEEALLAGNNYLASEIQKGISNFFVLRGLVCEVEQVGSNIELVHDWLRGIDLGIYEGTSNINLPNIGSLEEVHPIREPLEPHRSVIECFKLLNLFFDLNDLHTPKSLTAGIRMSDLIIPESFDGDGILG